MKYQIGAVLIIIIAFSCEAPIEHDATKSVTTSIQGTWKLLTGTLIEKNDTVVTDYTKGKEFIKIVNDTHFAFLMHDLSKGKNADSVFSAGGGDYSIKDSLYTEHLVYCSDRQWEGNSFPLSVSIHNDTLIQKGVEKIDSLGVNRMNIEKYVKVKN